MTDYISIKQILDNCLHHPMLQDLTLERAVAYAVDFLRIVLAPAIFLEKTAKLEVNGYRAILPCDFHRIIQVRTKHKNCDLEVMSAFRASTDSFHLSEDKSNSPELTYKIQGRVIFTSIKEGTIEIAYLAIAVDEDGYPLIPDNSSFTRALELYIKKQCFTIQFDQGKINAQVYNNVCLEYAFAVGQAQTDMIRPTIDEMEAITNMLNTLVPRVSDHNRGFRYNGTKEYIKQL